MSRVRAFRDGKPNFSSCKTNNHTPLREAVTSKSRYQFYKKINTKLTKPLFRKQPIDIWKKVQKPNIHWLVNWWCIKDFENGSLQEVYLHFRVKEKENLSDDAEKEWRFMSCQKKQEIQWLR